MLSIAGYYTSNACYSGVPFQFERPVQKYILEDEKGNVLSVSPSCLLDEEKSDQPQAACLSGDCSVSAKLLQSGNYKVARDGSLRSVYLSDRQRGPISKPEYPTTYITPLIAGEVDGIQEGKHLVFREYSGLKECVRVEAPGF